MAIVFRNMAYRSVTRKKSSHREKWLRIVPDALLGLFPANVIVHALKGKL